jgi:plasmid stabilization system protein ParE
LKVIWSQESLNQLIDIENFIAKDSPDRAAKFINRLIGCGESCKDYPYTGRVVPEFSIDKIREVYEQSYSIVHQITKARIEILAVFEGHQKLRRDDVFL